jgi:hypothetical protein
MAGILSRLLVQSDKLDEYLRFHDFYAHRTAGGRLDRWLGIDRHTVSALILPSIVCALMLLASPSASRTMIALFGLIVSGGSLALFMRLSAKRIWPIQVDLIVQGLVVLLTAALIWQFGKDEYQKDGVYRHVFAAVAVAMAVTLVLGAILVKFMFSRMHSQNRYDAQQTHYGDYLKTTELFASRGQAPSVTLGTIATSALTILFRSPLALLTVPAIVALISPTAYVVQLTLAALAICFLGLFFAAINERFGAMWTLLQQAFFKGGALLVSLIVIVLGVARVFGNTYVTPIFDSAAWWTLGVTFVSVYTLSWWYDYWSNRLLADQMIALVDRDGAGRAQIPYNMDPNRTATRVPADKRVLQIHGAGRLLALRDNTVIANAEGKVIYSGPVFQAYAIDDFISLLALSGAPGGKENPTLAQVRSRVLNFHSVLALIFVALIGVKVYDAEKGKQLPEVLVAQGHKGFPLTDLLNTKSGDSPDRTLIVIACSGGGTRAALYTASIMEGIARKGKTDDIVLGSGVSGGGAALAYFAANRDLLNSPDTSVRSKAWDNYFEAMQEPYIQDVLDRATEWRMAGPGRLGQLLDSSFQQRWNLRQNRSKLSDIQDLGLIFNTSLAGNVQRPMPGPEPLSDVEPSFRKDTKSTLAGGRLLLTNLALTGLTAPPLEPQESNQAIQLPVVIVDDKLRLEDAAALNANFPPVFSNAAIDVDQKTRYWVTDGGAEDNRGMEMMLYALLSALKNMAPEKRPRLLIVVADASSFSDEYSQDRGISSLAGAGSHFASHLDSELYSRICDSYSDKTRLTLAYVMMPDILRKSGSFGTHWMLQRWIRVSKADNSDSVTISGDEMIQVLRALHTGADLQSEAGKVVNWSREDDGHKKGWAMVENALGPQNSAALGGTSGQKSGPNIEPMIGGCLAREYSSQ